MDRNFMIDDGRYVFVEELGEGGDGTVWKAVDNMRGEVCAIKRINGSFSKYENCCNNAEVKCLVNLGPHPNIVCLHDVILEGTTLYLVLELMDCDLAKLMSRPLSEQEVRNFCFQILTGLMHMHKKGYCHRDLKPENLLVKGDTIKIADFGLAKNMSEPLESFVGTRPYLAPELFLGSTCYDFAVDIWSMGAIMAELFTGYPLFPGSNMVDQIYNICAVIGFPDTRTGLAHYMHFSFPEEFKNVDSTKQLSSLLPSASAQAIDLINCFLSWDPKRRPGVAEALHHPFFYPCYNIPRPDPLLPYPDGEQKSEYVSESIVKPFPGTGRTLQINPTVRVEVAQQMLINDHDNLQYQEDGNNKPLALSVGDFMSYRIPESLSIENLPSKPFPCIDPKLFNLFNRRMPCDDKINDPQGFGD